MKIAISTDQGYVSAHFGRCPEFTLVDFENGKIIKRETVPNPGHMPGAIPKFLHEQGAECIIAGTGARAEGFVRSSDKEPLSVFREKLKM